MNLKHLLKDNVFIEKAGGVRLGPFKAALADSTAVIFDSNLDVDDGEHLIRPLPSGKEEKYLILSTEYSPGLRQVEPFFTLNLQKTTAIQTAISRNTTVNINHSTGIQVGDHNVLNIQNALNELVNRIESSQGSPQEKADAKSRLAAFLAHPLVGSVLGGIAGGLVGGAGG